MSKINDLQDLVANVEFVRQEKYPHIPKELVEKIILEEYEQLDSRSEGMKKVNEIVSSYLSSNKTE